MEKDLNNEQFFAISAHTIDNKPKEVISLMRKNGLLIPPTGTKKDIDKGFAALIVKSKQFRKDFSELASKTYPTTSNFVYAGGGDDGSNDTPSNTSGTGSGSSSNTTLSSSKKKFDINKFLNEDRVGQWADTGIGLLANSINNKQNAKYGVNNTIQNGLNNARTNENNGGGSGGGNNNTSTSSGISTTTIVLIAVGSLFVVGSIIWFATRKGKSSKSVATA